MTTPRRQLVFISVVQVLAMATWFSASAVVPALLTDWGISQTRATWLTASVQLGFVTGAVLSAVVNLPDRALPQLVTSFAGLPWRGVLLVAGALALLGAVIALLRLRLGPLAAPTPPLNPRYVVTLFRDRGPRLANLGYLGHMWELYAMWTWLPAYLAASYAAHGTWGGSRTAVGLSAFLAIGVAGVAGCLIGGWFGDRFGRARTAAWAMATSATCCLLAAFAYGLHPLLVIVVLVVWGASVIADSALFSTCLTQVVDPRYVGTALTTQTAAGFLLTTVTIQAVPYVADRLSWSVAVAALSLGPAVGAHMMGRLHRHLAAAGAPTAVEAAT